MIDGQHAPMGRRTLLVVYPDGTSQTFEIQISAPLATSNEDYSCEVSADGVLFAGKQKVFGVDGIDALDYAIQFIDAAVANFRGGAIQWPDGTSYTRVSSGTKFHWG